MNLKWTQILILFISNVKPRNANVNYRVISGNDDVLNEFPYVVKILKTKGNFRRSCTGTLLAPQWVLTAGHCLKGDKIVEYGDMTTPDTKSLRKIIKKLRPFYQKEALLDHLHIRNDIGLLMIEEIFMRYGTLSSVDYKTLTGYRVRYAGFGLTTKLYGLSLDEVRQVYIEDNKKPLQLGEGLVVTCGHEKFKWGPAICVVAKCSNRRQQIYNGDSGGPVLHRGKVVGVASGTAIAYQFIFTPVSPYIDWLNRMIR